MKKTIIASLLMSTTIVFAKTEEPKFKKNLSKEDNFLVTKKNIKEEKSQIKIMLKPVQSPFQQCVFNNSMSLSLMYLSMGIPTESGFIEAVATASCLASFGGV
ncbi:hypothetical protein [Chryseobacterium daeguense]|uniref:hypothetical protein n=1 Tax=Chryseobacterium daeguense TaxID=412438 RepID=UPI0003F9BFF1|nr:hypothetical protein [Chryseobacterium daeguense]